MTALIRLSAKVQRYLVRITVGLMGLVVFMPGVTQAKDKELTLEEIVVTAQRREQTLKEVPTSITAFSGTTLEKLNVKDAQSYLTLTPNVSFDEGLRRGSRSIRPQIRGIGNLNPTALTNAVAANSIGMYLDGVSIGFSVNGTINPQLIDMERIEVLRGPQGTFFGLNAAAGALNLTTNRPDSKPMLKLMGEVGNDDKWNTAAIANYALSDTLMVRAVASLEQTAALVENLNPVGSDSSSDNKYFRLSVRWVPTDNLTVDAIYAYSEEEQDLLELVPTGRLGEFAGIFSPTAADPDFATTGAFNDPGVGFWPDNDGRRNVSIPCKSGRCPEFYNNDSDFFSGQLNYDGGWYIATGILGWTQTGHKSVNDNDGTSLAAIIKPLQSESETWSGEIRLASAGDGPIEWIVGGFYFDGEVRTRFNDQSEEDTACLPGVCFGPPGFLFDQFHNGVDFEDFAVFGNVTWHLTEKMAVSLGGRYTHDEFTDITFLRENFGSSPDQPQTVSHTTSAFTPKLSLTYDWTEDLTTYASVSQGYKPGGTVAAWRPATAAETAATGYDRLADSPVDYDEETLWNYEVGLRADFFDKKLRTNLSIFKIRWTDFQSRISRFVLTGGALMQTIQVLNAGDADINGFEFDFVAAATENFTLGGAVGYLDSEFRSFPNAFLESSLGPIDLTGKDLPGSPEWTANIWGEYRMPLTSEMEGFVRLQWRYRSEAISEFDGYSTLATGKSSLAAPSHDVGDLRFGIESDRFSISAYVENILEEEYHLGGQVDTTFYNGINVRPHPRQWGIKVSYTFF